MINTRSCMYTWAHWRSCRTGLLCGGSCTDLLFRTISMHAHHLVCLAASTGAMIPLLIPFELVLHLIGEAVWNISWCALDMGQQWGTGEYSEQGQPFQVEVTNLWQKTLLPKCCSSHFTSFTMFTLNLHSGFIRRCSRSGSSPPQTAQIMVRRLLGTNCRSRHICIAFTASVIRMPFSWLHAYSDCTCHAPHDLYMPSSNVTYS